MSGQGFTGTEVPEGFMDNFEFRVSITFPGEVKSATGDIDGNTVTWEPTIGENTRIEAVASAIPSKSLPLLIILLVAAGALVLGAVVYLLTHRGAPAPVAGPVDGATAMPVEETPPIPGGPSDPVAPVEPPPGGPEEPTTPIEPTAQADPVLDAPEAPGAAVPIEDEPPPPPASS